MAERKLHCWQGRREDIEERHGFGSPEWADTFQDGWVNGTCMLERGHDGPHRFTPDSDITVAFGDEATGGDGGEA